MFAKKPAGLLMARPTASRPLAGSTFSIFGADTAIRGDISASTELHMDGRIEGDVACSALIQSETSVIIGAVTVESARLAGVVRGTITAGELLIHKTAQIHGDVSYDALTIEPGAQVHGRLSTRNTLMLETQVPASGNGEPLLILAS